MKKIFTLALFLALTGCASIYTEGVKVNDAQMAALQDKKATQQDVIATLGHLWRSLHAAAPSQNNRATNIPSLNF